MEKTNAVLFGNYMIVLEKDQLMYYIDGELSTVKDVNPEFTTKDLYDLAKRISEKRIAKKRLERFDTQICTKDVEFVLREIKSF
jgi:hypothetical protein